jgi:hypothetical protein
MAFAELFGALPGVDLDYGPMTLCFGTQLKARGEDVNVVSSLIVNSSAG